MTTRELQDCAPVRKGRKSEPLSPSLPPMQPQTRTRTRKVEMSPRFAGITLGGVKTPLAPPTEIL